MSFQVKNINIYSFLIWIILFAAYPFVFTYALGYPALLPMLLSTITLFILCIKYKAYLWKKYSVLFFLMLLFFILQILIYGSIDYISNITQVCIVYVIVITVTNLVSLELILKQYIYIVTAIVLLGAVGWLSVFLFGYAPFYSYVAQDGRIATVYLFTICNSYVPSVEHPIIRYSGIFDEPGTLAFFSMLTLCMNRLYLRDIRVERILLFVPLLTFSMAHIITVFLYYVSFRIKAVGGYIKLFTFVFLSILFVVSLKDTEYERIYSLSIERFEYSDEKGLKGNSRESLTENAMSTFLENPMLGVGKMAIGDESMATNPFTILAYYGIIGYIVIQIFYFTTLTQTLFSRNCPYKWDILKCLIILFVNFQQRPFSTNVFTMTSILLLLLFSDKLLQRNQIA